MATRLPDGSIKLRDGRTVFANSLVQAQDLIEIMDLIVPCYIPAPSWPFISGGGGGGGGEVGVIGADGADGAAGVQGNQGFQGPADGATGPQGPEGNEGIQGFQGVMGAGFQGAQGNDGAPGSQGNDGAQGFQGDMGAGFQGAQGDQGSVGAQGIEGGQGIQGFQGDSGGAGPDIFAATRVVSLVAGEGTDLTIAAAIAALPAEGGKIFIKEGTFPIAATMTLPDKNVDFEGAGDGTIISLGANAISAFTIPTGLTAFRKYVFQDFKVTGTSIADQRVVTVSDALARGIVNLFRLKTEGIQQGVRVTAGDPGFEHAVQVSMDDVWMIPVADGTGALLRETLGVFREIAFRAVRVRFYDLEFGVLGGSLVSSASPFSGRVDGYFQNCFLHVATDSTFGSLYMEDCTVYSTTAGYKTITSFGSASLLNRSALIDVYAEGHIDIVFSETVAVLGGHYAGPRLSGASGSSETSSFVGIRFLFNGTNFAFGCLSCIGGNNLIEGCTFDDSSAPATSRYMEIGGGTANTVRGCNFRSLPATASCAVAILQSIGSFNSISDCKFDQPNVPPWIEFTGGSPMSPVQYHNNFFTTLTLSPTIIATGSRVDGVQQGDARITAAATAVPAVAYGMGRIVSLFTDAGNAAGGGTTDLQTHTVLARVLNQSLLLGRTIRIKAWGRTANNANVKTVTLNFGSQVVMTAVLNASEDGRWRIDCEVIKTGANTQRIFAELLQSPTVGVTQTPTAGTQTDTAAIIVKCTGASALLNDIVQEGMIIETS